MTEEIRFYRASGEYGFLSNLYIETFEFEGRMWACAEYAYQFGKPARPEVAEWLMAAPTPSLCAQAAHALFSWQVRSDWATTKIDRMRDVLYAKFTRIPELRDKLLSTGDALLIEESNMDAFWGIGKKGNGKNMLGKLLMEVRYRIRKWRELYHEQMGEWAP